MRSQSLAPLLGLSLCLAVGCRQRESAPAPLPPAPVAPSMPAPPPQPAVPTATVPTVAPNTGATPAVLNNPAPVVPSLPVAQGRPLRTHPTREAAIASLSEPISSGDTPIARIDVDGDHVDDEVYNTSDHGCVLVRRGAMGWSAETLTAELAHTAACAAPITVGGTVLLLASGGGHETNNDEQPASSSTWSAADLFVARAGFEAQSVWTDRVDETARGELADYAAAPLGTNAVLITHAIGSGTSVQHQYRVLVWNAARTALDEAGCRSTTVPTAPATRIPGCTARSANAVHLRPTEVTASEGPEIAANTSMPVWSAGTLRRGTTRMFCVQSQSYGNGFAFFAPEELSGCPAFP